jgi:hypothetical protein
MTRAFDMDPRQFSRHARAVEARFIKEQLRQVETPDSDQQPERLTADYAHVTDSTNFLLRSWGCPPEFRGFIDALIGVAGFRARSAQWFRASDKEIARRAGRCTKWVQIQRKELRKWQMKQNVGLIDIEDNQYLDGNPRAHKYRVNIARYAAESTLDARLSPKWTQHKFGEALEEAAKTMHDSLPEGPTYIEHKRSNLDAVTAMERDLSCALTKVTKAKEVNKMTGNQIELTPRMREAISGIRSDLDALENASRFWDC